MSARINQALRAAGLHFICCFAIALLAGALVFALWYPYPYREMSGGRTLFFLIIGVDIVCGPLLTFVLFNPSKPRTELLRDLSLVVLVQLAAFGYGLHTVWLARPLFLVHEVDRFKVVISLDIDSVALSALPDSLKPGMWDGPKVVAIRKPTSVQEKNRVLFSAIEGGRDYAERPEFYLPYDAIEARKSLEKAKSLTLFLEKWPEQRVTAEKLAAEKGANIMQWMYLPVVAREDWIAVLDKQGEIQGFLKGDGF